MVYPITLIAAMDINNLIGSHNTLPWNIKADLKHFKDLTQNQTVIMGRSTYESIGRPLPNRKNIILSSQKDYKVDGCIVFNDIESVLAYSLVSFEKIYIIGGSSIYSQFMPYAEEMVITHIDAEFEGDSYFPEIDYNDWILANEIQIPKGNDTEYNLIIKKYKRSIN